MEPITTKSVENQHRGVSIQCLWTRLRASHRSKFSMINKPRALRLIQSTPSIRQEPKACPSLAMWLETLSLRISRDQGLRKITNSYNHRIKSRAILLPKTKILAREVANKKTNKNKKAWITTTTTSCLRLRLHSQCPLISCIIPDQVNQAINSALKVLLKFSD